MVDTAEFADGFKLDTEMLNQYKARTWDMGNSLQLLDKFFSWHLGAGTHWSEFLSKNHRVSERKNPDFATDYPPYGWKIHIFATNTKDWQKLASALIPYLEDNDVCFKTLSPFVLNGTNRGEDANFWKNKKNNQYGKAFTIYPANDELFKKTVREINYILENNGLNNRQGFIYGDHQIGNHGRIFYRNAWPSANEPGYVVHAEGNIESLQYKPADMEDPFLSVLGYPNDNTRAEMAAKGKKINNTELDNTNNTAPVQEDNQGRTTMADNNTKLNDNELLRTYVESYSPEIINDNLTKYLQELSNKADFNLDAAGLENLEWLLKEVSLPDEVKSALTAKIKDRRDVLTSFEDKDQLYQRFHQLAAEAQAGGIGEGVGQVKPVELQDFVERKEKYVAAHADEKDAINSQIKRFLNNEDQEKMFYNDELYLISAEFKKMYEDIEKEQTAANVGNSGNVGTGKDNQSQPTTQKDDTADKPLTIGAIPGNGNENEDKGNGNGNGGNDNKDKTLNVGVIPPTQTQPQPEKEKTDEFVEIREEYRKLSLNGDQNDAFMDRLRVSVLIDMKKVENVDFDAMTEQQAIEILHDTLPKLSDKELKEMESKLTDRILGANGNERQSALLGMVPPLVLAEKYEELRGIVNETKSGAEHDEALDKLNKVGDRIDKLASDLLNKKTNTDFWFNDYTNIADIHYGYKKMFAAREEDLIELAKEGNQSADQRVGIMRSGMAMLEEQIQEYDKRMNLSNVTDNSADLLNKRFDTIKPRIDAVELTPETLEMVSHYKFRNENGKIESQFELPDGSYSDKYVQGAKIIEGGKLDTMLKMAKQDVLLESLGANESALTDENLKKEVNDRLPFKLFEIDAEGKANQLAATLGQDSAVMAKDQFTNTAHLTKFLSELRNGDKECSHVVFEIARDRMVEKNRAFTQRVAQKIESQEHPVLFKIMDSVKDFDKRAADRDSGGKVSRKDIWKSIGKRAALGGGIAFATSFALSTGAAALAADASLTSATLGMNKFAGAILGTGLGLGAMALHVKKWRKSQKEQGKPAGIKAFLKNPQNIMSVATSALGGFATGALLTGNPAVAQWAGYSAIAIGALNGATTNYAQIKKAGGNTFDAVAGGLLVGGSVIGGGYLGREASHMAIDMFNKYFPDNEVFRSQHTVKEHIKDGEDKFVFNDRNEVVKGSQNTLDHFYEGNEAQLKSDLADIREFYKAHGIDFPEERALVMLADGGTNTNTDTVNYTPHGNVHTHGNNLCMHHGWADARGLDHSVVDALNVQRGPDGHLMMNMDAHNAIMKVNPFVSAHNAIGYVPNTETYGSGIPLNASRDGANIPVEDLTGGKEFGTYINHGGIGHWEHTPGVDQTTTTYTHHHGNIMATFGNFFKPLGRRVFKMGSALADKTISVFKRKPKEPPVDNTPVQTPPTDKTPVQTPPAVKEPPVVKEPPAVKEPPVVKEPQKKPDERLTPLLEGLEKRKLLCEEFQMVYGYNPAVQKVKDNDGKIQEKPTNPSKDSNFVEFEGVVEKERVASGGKPMLEFLRERREKYMQTVGEGLKDKELAAFKENPASHPITKDIRQDYLHSSSAENNTWSFAKFTEHAKAFIQRLNTKQNSRDQKNKTKNVENVKATEGGRN